MAETKGRAIRLEDLTLDQLIDLGAEHVTDRLPKPILLAAARKYVQATHNQRERAKALAAERRAYGMTVKGDSAPDNLADIVREASLQAAANATMTWRPLLHIPFLVPSKDIQTTWGSATIDMHIDRAMYLERAAVGSLRTASHHRKAVDDIGELKVSNLLEVVQRGRE